MPVFPDVFALFVIAVVTQVAGSNPLCWNDYQLGLDDGSFEGKKAAQITAKSFHCPIDMHEVRHQLPAGGSCYEVGVRNGALWQLQTLHVVKQCSNEDVFNGDWAAEPVPQFSLDDVKRFGLQTLNGVGNDVLAPHIQSVKDTFTRKASSSAAKFLPSSVSELLTTQQQRQQEQEQATRTMTENNVGTGVDGGQASNINNAAVAATLPTMDQTSATDPQLSSAPLRSDSGLQQHAGGVGVLTSIRSRALEGIRSGANLLPVGGRDGAAATNQAQAQMSATQAGGSIPHDQQRLVATGTDPDQITPDRSSTLPGSGASTTHRQAPALDLTGAGRNVGSRTSLTGGAPQEQVSTVQTFQSESKTIV